MNGRKIEIKPTDVKVLGRAVSITTDKTLVAAEQTVDESFDPNKNYPGTFEDHSQWTINRLLKSKIDALSSGIPSNIEPATTDKYGIVRLASDANDSDPWDVVTMNLFKPVFGDVENNKTRLAKLEECCEEVQEFIKKKDVPEIINTIPNSQIDDILWSEDSKTVVVKIKGLAEYDIECTDVLWNDLTIEDFTVNITSNGSNPEILTISITRDLEFDKDFGDIVIIGTSLSTIKHLVTVKGENVMTKQFKIPGDLTQLDVFLEASKTLPGSMLWGIETSIIRDIINNDRHSEFYDATPNTVNATFEIKNGWLPYINISDITTDTTVILKGMQQHGTAFTLMTSTENDPDQKVNWSTINYTQDTSAISYSPLTIYYGDHVAFSISEPFAQNAYATHVKIYNGSINSLGDIIYDEIVTEKTFDIPFAKGNITAVLEVLVGVTYPITYNGTNYNTTNAAVEVASGDSYSTTITPTSGYKIDGVTVTMNGTPINQAWDRTTGKLIIGSVTGPVVITVSTSSNVPQTVQYNVTYQYSGLVRGNVNFGGNNGQPINVVTSGNKYSCSIAPQPGYHISSATIKTTSGGQVVSSTYTNNILTSSVNITEDITVIITGVKNNLSAEIKAAEDADSISRDKQHCMVSCTGGVVQLLVNAIGAGWTVVGTSHSLDPRRGWTSSMIPTENDYIDDIVTPSTISSISPNSGSGNQVVSLTFPSNREYGNQYFIVTVSNGSDSIDLTILQPVAPMFGQKLSNYYIASPYSQGFTTQHKFYGSWKRVQGPSSTSADPDTNAYFDNSMITAATLSATTGSASDLLTITSNTNVDPSDVGTNLSYHLYFRIDGKNETIYLHHAFDCIQNRNSGAGYGTTKIKLTDSNRTDNYITNVYSNNNPIVSNNTDVNLRMVDITGESDGIIQVQIGNTSNITSDNIVVKYRSSEDSGLIYDTNDPMTEGVTWKEVAFTYNGGIIEFNTTGMICPCNGMGEPNIWQYEIEIS